ncbi:MAG: DUF4437 domain-containing protein [Methylophilaceae bacterium]
MNFTLKLILPLMAMLCVTSSFAQQATTQDSVVSFPVSTLKWVEIPETGGIKYANLRGDLAGKGAYEAFVIFPAGKDNPFHYHSKAIPTVVLKGTFYAVINGVRTEYPVGSFYDIPAKFKHFSGCVNGQDCLLFQYQDGPFDLIPLKKP